MESKGFQQQPVGNGLLAIGSKDERKSIGWAPEGSDVTGVDRHGDAVWRDAWEDVQVGFFGRLKEVPSTGDASLEAWRGYLPAALSVSSVKQVHGAAVQEGAPGCVGEGDALVTPKRRLALTVVTADCVPILLASRNRLAAVHAGWRGVVAEILAATWTRLEPTDPCVAWIGPSIGGCCYEVGDEVAQQVAAVSHPSVIQPRHPRPHVDLVAAVRWQLRALGVTDIRAVPQCTRCASDSWWSYRQAGASARRNVAAIWRS